MHLSTVLRAAAAALVIGGTIASATAPAAAMERGNGSWLDAPRCASAAPFAGGACLAIIPAMGSYDPGYQYDVRLHRVAR